MVKTFLQYTAFAIVFASFMLLAVFAASLSGGI
jgi:hypothetical protein